MAGNKEPLKKAYTKEEIERMVKTKAQELCNKRGCSPGKDWADWFEAERLVKRQLNIR